MRDLRAHAADGRTGDSVLAERRHRLRRRLPAVRRHRDRVRLGARGRADVADRARRAARGAAASSRGSSAPGRAASRRRSPPSRSCAGSPSTSSRWSRRPISSTRRSTGARSAGSASRSARRKVSVVVALRGQRRGGRDGRLGHLLVPVPRLARTRTTRSGSRSAATIPSELEGPFTEWNAHMEDDGRIVPDIARL